MRRSASTVSSTPALDQHCREASRIIKEFSGGWYGKTLYEKKGISQDDARKFAHVAFKKLRAELSCTNEETQMAENSRLVRRLETTGHRIRAETFSRGRVKEHYAEARRHQQAASQERTKSSDRSRRNRNLRLLRGPSDRPRGRLPDWNGLGLAARISLRDPGPPSGSLEPGADRGLAPRSAPFPFRR